MTLGAGGWTTTGSGDTKLDGGGQITYTGRGNYTRILDSNDPADPIKDTVKENGKRKGDFHFSVHTDLNAGGARTNTGGGDAKQSSEDHFSYDGSGNATYHSEGTTITNAFVDKNTYDSTLAYNENGGTDKSASVSSHWTLDPNGWRPDTTHRNETGSDNGRYKFTFGDFTQDDISGDGLTEKLTKTNTDTYGENYNYHFTRSLNVNVAPGGAVTTSGSGTGDGTEHGLAEHELDTTFVYDTWDGYGNWSHGETQTTDHSKYSNDYTEGWSESYATNGPPSAVYGVNKAPGRNWGGWHSTGSNQDGAFAPESSSYNVTDSGMSCAPGMNVNHTFVAYGFHNTWPHPQVWQYNGHFGFGSPPSAGAVGLDIAKSLGVGGAVDPSTAQPAGPQAKEVTINGEQYIEFQKRQPDGSFKTACDKKFNPVVIDNGPSGLTMYGHYLRHPGEMDSDLRTAQKVAVGVAVVSREEKGSGVFAGAESPNAGQVRLSENEMSIGPKKGSEGQNYLSLNFIAYEIARRAECSVLHGVDGQRASRLSRRPKESRPLVRRTGSNPARPECRRSLASKDLNPSRRRPA